jgi:hypothetical protein
MSQNDDCLTVADFVAQNEAVAPDDVPQSERDRINPILCDLSDAMGGVELPTGGYGPTGDMVAYYPFEGNADDVTGNGHDGDTVQGVTYGSGNVGQAAIFEEGDYIEVADDSDLDIIGGSFTIALWMKTTSNDRGGLIRKNMVDSWQPVYSVEFDYGNNHQIRFLLSDEEGATPDIDSTTQINDGEWHHVVAMYDDDAGDDGVGEMTLYVDGMRENSRSMSFDQTDTTGNLQFGRMYNEDRGVVGQLDGSLDEVRIYDRTLSDSEIMDLSSQGSGGQGGGGT